MSDRQRIGKHGVRHGDESWRSADGSDSSRWWDGWKREEDRTSEYRSAHASGPSQEDFPPLRPKDDEVQQESREAAYRQRKLKLWVNDRGVQKTVGDCEHLLRDYNTTRPNDSYGASIFCSDLDKMWEEKRGQYGKSYQVLNVPASCLVKTEQEEQEKDSRDSIAMLQTAVQRLLNENKVGTRGEGPGTRFVFQKPPAAPSFHTKGFPVKSNDGGRKVRPLLLDARSRRLQAKKVNLWLLRWENEDTWGIMVASRIEFSYQLTLCGYTFQLEAKEVAWLPSDLEHVERFHQEVLGDCDEPEAMLVKVKQDDTEIQMDVEAMAAGVQPSAELREALKALSRKAERLVWWELVRLWSQAEPAPSPLKLHKILDEPEDFEKEEFEHDRKCLVKIGKQSLKLAAAVAESAQEREKDESKVDLSWEVLDRKVQEYVNKELAATLMVHSGLMQLGTRKNVREYDAAMMLFALVGAHKQESDMFAVVQFWDWLIRDPVSGEIRPKEARSLQRSNDFTAGCPRYLGRTASYIEFGEVLPPQEERHFSLYLRVRYEDYNDAYYRWNGPQAEEKRPETPSENEWKPLSWDFVQGTFCSPSMKTPTGEARPLPNKVCSWLRGRSMKKLVSIKHSVESTPPYSYLREENNDEGNCLFVVYRGYGEVKYRRAKNGGLGEEIAMSQQDVVHYLSYSEHKKTLVSQVVPGGWALPRKVTTWLLEMRSLGDLIPGRKKTISEIKFDAQGLPCWISSHGDEVKIQARAIPGQCGCLFEAQVDGQWKALSYSEDKKDWVFNPGNKAGMEDVVPWDAISIVSEKSNQEGPRLTTPTSVRRFFPNASGTAVARIEQITDHRFNNIKLFAEGLTHCSAVGSAVQPMDHLAYVGAKAMKVFTLEKLMQEASFFSAHLVVKEEPMAKTFCAPKGLGFDKGPTSETAKPIEWRGNLHDTLNRFRACCNHVGYAVSCIKNELHKNINCSSKELQDNIKEFERRLGKEFAMLDKKWPGLFKLAAPKALGDLFLACIGAITMDSDHNEARNLMQRHYDQSESIMPLLVKEKRPNHEVVRVDRLHNVRDEVASQALMHRRCQDQALALAPELLSVEREGLPEFWKFCKDLQFLKVLEPKEQKEEWIACSSPKSMLLYMMMKDETEEGELKEESAETQSENELVQDEEGAIFCEACQMWLNGPTQWADHEIGKKHRKAVHRQQAAKQDVGKPAEEAKEFTPDPDKKGLEHEAIYCKYCDMWLNGPTQWADHEIGKRHKKAIRHAEEKGLDTVASDPSETDYQGQQAQGVPPPYERYWQYGDQLYASWAAGADDQPQQTQQTYSFEGAFQ